MANKILDTQFTFNDCLFIIHRNNKLTVYEGKYKLLMYNDQVGCWMRKATGDSLRELKQYAKENALYW